MEAFPRTQVIELHSLVRAWAEVGSKIGAVPLSLQENPTVAYLDLMFAYGQARLGEVEQSAELAEAARTALEAFPADTDKGMAGRFLYKAFKLRIDQAAAGHLPSSRLSPALLDELDELDRKSGGMANSPPGIAHFVITRLLAQSRILEPHERLDPLKRFINPHEGGLKQALYALIDERDPERLAALVRELYRRAGSGPSMTQEQFEVLRDCLPLSARVGADFAAELIRLVPEALRQSYPKQSDPLLKRACLLECGFQLTGHFGLHDLAGQLAEAFTELVTAATDGDRTYLISRVAEPCVRCLRQLGLRDELDGLLQRLLPAALDGGSLSDLKAKFSDQREPWVRAVQTLQGIAGGWLALGRTDQANPILDASHAELLTAPVGTPMPQEYTRLATAYIAAVGHGPAEGGFCRLNELFRRIDPNRITNSFTTAPFFSRLHLEVAEVVVLAVLEMLRPTALPGLRSPAARSDLG